MNRGATIFSRAGTWALALFAQAVISEAAFLVDVPVGQAIPDGDASGMASSISITGQAGAIGNLSVTLNISGGYNGDLYAYLAHGNGFAVLLNRVGRSVSNEYGYGDAGMRVTFSDSAANGDVHTYRDTLLGNPDEPLFGSLEQTWQPDGRNITPFDVLPTDSRTALLSSFTGSDPNGLWTLFLADLSSGQVATLDSWRFESAAVPEPSTFISGLFMAFICVSHLWKSRA